VPIGLWISHGSELWSTARDEAVGWDTALQAGRSRVRLECFIDIILPAALWPWHRLEPLTEMSTRNIFWVVKAAGA